MSAIESVEVSASFWAVAIFFSVTLCFLPPFLPLALAAANPARVLSRMMLRSNSAREQKMWKISLPLLVVVSMLSVRLANPIPLALRSSTTEIRCLRERPKRSSRHTTRVSHGRSCSRALSRPGRDARAPLALSVKMREQLAAFNASVCKSNVCSSRLTRAYPIFTLVKCLATHHLYCLTRHAWRDELRDTKNGHLRIVQHRESECLINDRLRDTLSMAPHQAHAHKLDTSHTWGIT